MTKKDECCLCEKGWVTNKLTKGKFFNLCRKCFEILITNHLRYIEMLQESYDL